MTRLHKITAAVPEGFARKHSVLPVGFEPDGSLRVASMVPNDFQLLSQLSSMSGHQTKFALALSGGLDELIDRTYSVGATAQPTVLWRLTVAIIVMYREEG